METLYRQRRFSRLTPEQQKVKLEKDSEYEIAVQNLSASFYQKKRTVGVTAKEEETYKQAKSKLWEDYKTWAISEGLYEEITPEQQLTELEDNLNVLVEQVNLIRIELGRKPIKAIERDTGIK